MAHANPIIERVHEILPQRAGLDRCHGARLRDVNPQLTEGLGIGRIVSGDLDLWPTRPLWADDRTLVFTADERGHHLVRTLDLETGESRLLTTKGHASELRLSPDRRTAYVLIDRFDAPMDIWRVPVAGGTPERLTDLNRALLKDIPLSPGISLEVAGFEGKPVQVWEVRPPDFDAKKTYPFLLWIHGGPIHAYLDQFHFRWSPHVEIVGAFER